MNGDKSALQEFGKRWAEAELARDLTVLDALAHRTSCWSDRWDS